MSKNARMKNAFYKVLATLMVIGGIVVPVTSVVANTSQPRDNDSNAIMWGGCYTKQECLTKITSGDGHNSAANLQQIYYNEGRGVTQTNFLSANTVDGTVYKDGRVVVNGQTVATGARSVGRTNMTGSVKVGSVYERSTSVSFAATSIPAYVNMEGGTFHYFIIKSCGNWGKATPVTKPTPSPTASKTPTPTMTPSPSPTATPSPSPSPTATPSPSKSPTPSPTPSPTASPSPSPTATPALIFKCVELIPSQPDRTNKPSTFRFTVIPEVSDNVTLTGFRFHFSDGSAVVDTPADQPFIERNLTSGSLKVQAQVKTSAGITALSEGCSATVTVNQASPTASVTPTPSGNVLGATLPATGPEAALGGIAGLSAIGWASRAYLRSRKSLLDALRKPDKQS